MPSGAAVGAACSDATPCRPGLTCNPSSNVCEPGHTSMQGDACVISPECADELQCVGGACVPAGTGDTGATCNTDADCVSGLRCGIVGLAQQCQPAGMKTSRFMHVEPGLLRRPLLHRQHLPSRASGIGGGALWAGVDCDAPAAGTTFALTSKFLAQTAPKKPTSSGCRIQTTRAEATAS